MRNEVNGRLEEKSDEKNIEVENVESWKAPDRIAARSDIEKTASNPKVVKARK